MLVHPLQEIRAESGVPPEEGAVRVLHPDKPLPGEVEAVRVEAVVGAQGVKEKPLEAAQVFTHKLRVRVGGKLVSNFLLKTLKKNTFIMFTYHQSFHLEHSHGRMFLESLSQVEANLHKSILGLEVVFLYPGRSPGDPLLAEVLLLLVVDELLQQLLVFARDQVHEVAPGLRTHISPHKVLFVNPIHTHQHLLILQSLFCSPPLLHPDIVSAEVPPDLEWAHPGPPGVAGVGGHRGHGPAAGHTLGVGVVGRVVVAVVS